MVHDGSTFHWIPHPFQLEALVGATHSNLPLYTLLLYRERQLSSRKMPIVWRLVLGPLSNAYRHI